MFFLDAVGRNGFCTRGRPRGDPICFRSSYFSRPPLFREEAGGRFVASSGREPLPMSLASFEAAEKYCAWVGKRLPTAAEWEYAASFDPTTKRTLRYSWGDDFDPKRTACEERLCHDGFDDDDVLGLAPVGTFDGTGKFQDGSSPWGVHDMAGNGMDWTSELSAGCSLAAPTRHCSAVQRPAGGGELSDPRVLTLSTRSMAPLSASGAIRCVRDP